MTKVTGETHTPPSSAPQPPKYRWHRGKRLRLSRKFTKPDLPTRESRSRLRALIGKPGVAGKISDRRLQAIDGRIRELRRLLAASAPARPVVVERALDGGRS